MRLQIVMAMRACMGYVPMCFGVSICNSRERKGMTTNNHDDCRWVFLLDVLLSYI